MYEPIVDNTGPNLGKLAVWSRTRDRDDNVVMTPLWRLQNGQGPSWKYAQANIDSDKDYEVRNNQIKVNKSFGTDLEEVQHIAQLLLCQFFQIPIRPHKQDADAVPPR